jgi:hypothetical protein
MKTTTCHFVIYVFLLLVCFTNCAFSGSKNLDKNQKNTISITGNIKFDSTVDSLLHLFVQKANCQDCYYEMYIDKRDINETLICLRASLKYPKGINDSKELLTDYLKKRKPTLYTKINNVTVFVYTGIEDMIILSSHDENIEFNKNRSSFYEYTWVIRKKNNKYNVFEGTWVVPFEKTEFKGIVKFNELDSE